MGQSGVSTRVIKSWTKSFHFLTRTSSTFSTPYESMKRNSEFSKSTESIYSEYLDTAADSDKNIVYHVTTSVDADEGLENEIFKIDANLIEVFALQSLDPYTTHNYPIPSTLLTIYLSIKPTDPTSTISSLPSFMSSLSPFVPSSMAGNFCVDRLNSLVKGLDYYVADGLFAPSIVSGGQEILCKASEEPSTSRQFAYKVDSSLELRLVVDLKAYSFGYSLISDNTNLSVSVEETVNHRVGEKLEKHLVIVRGDEGSLVILEGLPKNMTGLKVLFNGEELCIERLV